MLPVIQIGPLALQTSGLVILFGVWFGFYLTERSIGHHRIQPELIERIGFISGIAYILGGRLAYFSRHLDAFLSQPLSFFSLTTTLFDVTGGMIICAIAAIVTVQVRKLNGWQVLDAFTPLFLVLHTAVWLALAASGEAYGTPTRLPWGVDLWGAIRHPVQIYFFIANLLITGMFFMRGGAYARFSDLKDGSRFLAALFFVAISWVVFSPLLYEAEWIANRFSALQIASWVIALVSSIVFVKFNAAFIDGSGSETGSQGNHSRLEDDSHITQR
jgi:phosphatidylglycerol---prolipoprotein diacylglyceryl transferase